MILNKLPFRNWSMSLVGINLLFIIIVILVQQALPPVVPLFYGRPYGAAQLAPKIALVVPPSVALIVCILNSLLNLSIKDDFLRKVLLGGMVMITVLSAITVIKIILLVGSF